MSKELLNAAKNFAAKSKPMGVFASVLFSIFIFQAGVNPAKASDAVQAAPMVVVQDCSTEECQMKQTLARQLQLINRAEHSGNMVCYATAKKIEEQMAEMYDRMGLSVVRFSSGWMNIIHNNCGF